ncbi:hypothetical protein QM100_09380 [Enterobacter asburiae]|uniref:hypothetical protein n=1 Tax=Enterobacter cloacae complex TaxID=354276 RepID=UPI0028DFA0BF|nr:MULTISPECIES: hypothetical protein [Enterobacter cloacae complex]MDT8891208.1 hypothetical protein [Enterobacter cloacae]MDV5192612.1 hypothetical protein [Enterobacter asburiae]MDV5268813.1 hypothetical protein [Enterobacter asburiae]
MEISYNNDMKDIPIFAAATGATAYKFGEETFVDIMFYRPVFKITQPVIGQQPHSDQLEDRGTTMSMCNVNNVTLTEHQARLLIQALQTQLDGIKDM